MGLERRFHVRCHGNGAIELMEGNSILFPTKEHSLQALFPFDKRKPNSCFNPSPFKTLNLLPPPQLVNPLPKQHYFIGLKPQLVLKKLNLYMRLVLLWYYRGIYFSVGIRRSLRWTLIAFLMSLVTLIRPLLTYIV